MVKRIFAALACAALCWHGAVLANVAPTITITAPANNAVYSAPAYVLLNVNAADSDGTITQVRFYNGSTVIGTTTTAPYTFGWSNVAAGTYNITAIATDNAWGTTTSNSVTVSVLNNSAPTVSVTAGAPSGTAPATVALTATAADSDGSIAKVDFFDGATLIATKTATPYTYSWANVAAGTHSVTAKATDNRGAVTTSTVVSVQVVANTAPTVSMTAPANNASYKAPATIALTATAADADGSIAKVDFYNGTTLLGSDTTAPYTYSWANVAVGTYSITAKATDNRGVVTTSSPITANVTANVAPTITITAPANNAVYGAPAYVLFNVNAADSDGTITQVRFYNGTTVVGTTTTAPYTFALSNVAVGTYSFKAVVTDNAWATTTSNTVTVSVVNNSAPTVALTAGSPSGAAPATVALTATATDADGSITKVDFFDGATLLATKTAAPYTYSWTNVAAGSHSVTAKATDNLGATKVSAVVPVTVTGPQVGVYYIQADQLDTPRLITDAANKTVWTWNSDPFGATPPNQDPTASGKTFVFNPRFPGQYFDRETNLHYNYFRDYDSSTGRYVESDPIGLRGGLNRYAYVFNSPLKHLDPFGLNPFAGATAGAEVGSIAGPAGTLVGGLVGTGIGWWLADKLANISFAKPKPGSKPDGCPTGTKPIDQIPGLDRDNVHDIKDGVGAGPRDWTGIAPNGDVITGDANGNAVNHGPYNDYLP